MDEVIRRFNRHFGDNFAIDMASVACEPAGMRIEVCGKSMGNTVADILRPVLSRYPGVVAAYLFGSVASGKQGPLSDIDIALLFSDVSAPRETVGRLQDDLCRILHTDAVDLVLLNEAPDALAYRVIQKGVCVHSADDRLRAGYATRVIMRYLDFKPVREQAFRLLRKKILEEAA